MNRTPDRSASPRTRTASTRPAWSVASSCCTSVRGSSSVDLRPTVPTERGVSAGDRARSASASTNRSSTSIRTLRSPWRRSSVSRPAVRVRITSTRCASPASSVRAPRSFVSTWVKPRSCCEVLDSAATAGPCSAAAARSRRPARREQQHVRVAAPMPTSTMTVNAPPSAGEHWDWPTAANRPGRNFVSTVMITSGTAMRLISSAAITAPNGTSHSIASRREFVAEQPLDDQCGQRRLGDEEAAVPQCLEGWRLANEEQRLRRHRACMRRSPRSARRRAART